MKKICRTIYECVAFTTGGHFKSIIKPQDQWRAVTSDKDGLYVADINVCQAGQHNCYGNSTCKYIGTLYSQLQYKVYTFSIIRVFNLTLFCRSFTV